MTNVHWLPINNRRVDIMRADVQERAMIRMALSAACGIMTEDPTDAEMAEFWVHLASTFEHANVLMELRK